MALLSYIINFNRIVGRESLNYFLILFHTLVFTIGQQKSLVDDLYHFLDTIIIDQFY